MKCCVNNKDYPEIADDYVRSFGDALPSVDVFLGAHGNFYNLTEKCARLERAGARIPSSIPRVSNDAWTEAKTFQTRLAEQKKGAE